MAGIGRYRVLFAGVSLNVCVKYYIIYYRAFDSNLII